MLILDLDLDFMVRPIRQASPDKDVRYERPDVEIWPEARFRTFLEDRLHLSQANIICGRACEHHKEVFFHIRALIGNGVLVPPLHLVHIDAHDDIVGCSDAGQITSADFLLHLIGQDWLNHLDLVLPEGEAQERVCLIKWDPLRIEFGNHRCPIGIPDLETYCLPRKPDFVFLTRSPDFTPERADPLFDLAKSYIAE
jgi:hypothetical protein